MLTSERGQAVYVCAVTSRMRRAATVAVAATLVAGSSAAAKAHPDGAGRLSASSGSGGFVAAAPVHRSYWISEGDWVLCDTARDNGSPTEDITITGVRHVVGKLKPLEVRAYLRTVTPRQVARHPRKPTGVYAPFVATLGRPALFRQRYADHRWAPRGTYTRAIAGHTVLRGCDETMDDALADAIGEVPEHAWTTLVLAVKVGHDGARVRRTLVDYTVGETAQTLRINWVVGGQGYRHHR